MDLTFVNHRYWPFRGGSERWVQAIAEDMSARGARVRVVTSDAFDLEYFWDRRRRRVVAAPSECHNGVDIERVRVRHVLQAPTVFQGTRRLMGELARVPVPARVYALIAERQPWLPDLHRVIGSGRADIVHATNLGLEGLALHARHAATRHGARFVLTPFLHLGVDGDRRVRRYVTMPHQVQLLRGADAVIAMTNAEAQFIESLGVDPARVTVSGAGVHMAEVTGGSAARAREKLGVSGFLAGSLGALAPDKGSCDVVLAVGELRAKGVDIELALAGPMLSSFERWFAALRPEQRDGVHLLGFVTDAEKRDLLAALDVLVLPSRTESFGIVYLEAWANNKPVIAADTPVTRELIEDGVTGFLTRFGDVSGLARLLEELHRCSDLRLQAGAEGYNRVTCCHTWSHVVQRTRRAYEQLLVGGSAIWDRT
jgi:glycogen(starch) synthase